MSFFIALEAGHLPLGRAIARDVALLLAVEALVAAAGGALAGEVSFDAAFETFRGGSTLATACVGALSGEVALFAALEASRTLASVTAE